MAISVSPRDKLVSGGAGVAKSLCFSAVLHRLFAVPAWRRSKFSAVSERGDLPGLGGVGTAKVHRKLRCRCRNPAVRGRRRLNGFSPGGWVETGPILRWGSAIRWREAVISSIPSL